MASTNLPGTSTAGAARGLQPIVLAGVSALIGAALALALVLAFFSDANSDDGRRPEPVRVAPVAPAQPATPERGSQRGQGDEAIGR